MQRQTRFCGASCCLIRLDEAVILPVRVCKESVMAAEQARLAIDARYFQIAALFTLLFLSNFWSDFGSGAASFACALGGCLGGQWLFARLRGDDFDWRSPLITSCSLALLMRAGDPGWFLAAGGLAMASKALIRWNGKHIFNPANGAIVALLLLGDAVWITPGLWGQVAWAAGVMIGFGALVLSRAHRLDIALAFVVAYALCLIGRAIWLGDPLTIPLHQLQSGSLIVFTCFMITDPRSTANHRMGRIVFASLVALTALILQMKLQLVGAPLYALALLSPLTPLIDRLLAGQKFEWIVREGVGHEKMV
jgi:enediyne biosynthesis protein E5